MSKYNHLIEKYNLISKNYKQIRNIGVSAHIDHGKTTLSDNLLLATGLISKELAGKKLVLDFDEQEKKRGITISAASSTIIYSKNGTDYSINLIDTPGHVDFGDDVTRAMRVLDGSIVVVAAIEGIMPQTETVIFQCLKERVKPILFINKVDRVIVELQETKEQIFKRIKKITEEVNLKIKEHMKQDPFIDESWYVSIQKNTVLLGSAYKNWAISAKTIENNNFTFNNVLQYYEQKKEKELSEIIPLYKCVLDAVVLSIPNPVEAQKYRIEKIWSGDLTSETGIKLMKPTNENNFPMFLCNKVIFDSLSNPIAIGRIFSGTIKKGQELFILRKDNSKIEKQKVQNIFVCSGNDKSLISTAYTGNLVGLSGISNIYSGDTLSSEDTTPFEEIKHHSQPVYTRAVRPKDPGALGALLETLSELNKRDPALKITINKSTGEYLISGMGELHLETIFYRIEHEYKLSVLKSDPIVMYRETIMYPSNEIEGKSPNRHNVLFFKIEPLEQEVVSSIQEGEIFEGVFKKQQTQIDKLVSLGLPRAQAKRIMFIFGENLFIDGTKGAQLLKEVTESMKLGFQECVSAGPIMAEKLSGVKVIMTDIKIHVDNVHRGPAQIIPAMKRAIFKGIVENGQEIQEPFLFVELFAPSDKIDVITQLIQDKRGQIIDMDVTKVMPKIQFIAPIETMTGFSNEIRGITRGKTQWTIKTDKFRLVPNQLKEEVIASVRQRKGLPKENIFLKK